MYVRELKRFRYNRACIIQPISKYRRMHLNVNFLIRIMHRMKMLHAINARSNDDIVTLHYVRLIESHPSNHCLFKFAENHGSNDNNYLNNSTKFCIICCRRAWRFLVERDRISLIIPYLPIRAKERKKLIVEIHRL